MAMSLQSMYCVRADAIYADKHVQIFLCDYFDLWKMNVVLFVIMSQIPTLVLQMHVG